MQTVDGGNVIFIGSASPGFQKDGGSTLTVIESLPNALTLKPQAAPQGYFEHDSPACSVSNSKSLVPAIKSPGYECCPIQNVFSHGFLQKWPFQPSLCHANLILI